MRSVFAFLRGTTEAEVATYLDQTYPSQPRPPWIMHGGDGPSLYIRFYRDLSEEWAPNERMDLTHRLGAEPAVAVMADISGRIPGDEQAFEFLAGLLGHFSGAAMDDYTVHLWSLAELQAGHLVSGHRFFDYNGWYDGREKDD
jgi:hypothetical protein